MKTRLKSTSFFFAGVLIFSACTEEMGNSPTEIADNIDVDFEEIAQDTVPLDTTVVEEPIEPPPPPPPSDPWPPEPYPDPEPEPWPPEPIPIPEPQPPLPIPQEEIVSFPDVEPKYPEGEEELMKFISKNIKYPEIDLEMGNQGRVFLEFIVEKDGTLTNFKVLKGVSKSIDKEAMRVAELMPKWKPGKAGGEIVRTSMRLPITFRLN